MRFHPLADATAIMLVRFLIMFFTLEVAAAAGVGGWYLGLLANVAVTIFAAVLVTRRRLWASIGATTLWRSWWALAALAPLALDAVSWALPARLVREDPGFLLWGVTLLLVGVNEELISRGVILSRLEVAYRPLLAVTITAALFGLQHLSAFALTSREAGDILGNVALSGIYGFALAAFQWRFRWIWPLILVHALADFVTLLAAEPLSDGLIVAAQVTMLALGLVLLRWRVPPVDADLPRTHDAGVRTRLTGRGTAPGWWPRWAQPGCTLTRSPPTWRSSGDCLLSSAPSGPGCPSSWSSPTGLITTSTDSVII